MNLQDAIIKIQEYLLNEKEELLEIKVFEDDAEFTIVANGKKNFYLSNKKTHWVEYVVSIFRSYGDKNWTISNAGGGRQEKPKNSSMTDVEWELHTTETFAKILLSACEIVKEITVDYKQLTREMLSIIKHDNGAGARGYEVVEDEGFINNLETVVAKFFANNPECLKEECIEEICIGEVEEVKQKYGEKLFFFSLNKLLNEYFEEL